MTKALENTLNEPFDGDKYSYTTAKMMSVDSRGADVLDLSCKKIQTHLDTVSSHVKESMIAHYQESLYLENQQETNNNWKRRAHSETIEYHHEHQTHQQRYPGSGSPESRACIMTPPSECESPKKIKLESGDEHSNFTADEPRLSSRSSFEKFSIMEQQQQQQSPQLSQQQQQQQQQQQAATAVMSNMSMSAGSRGVPSFLSVIPSAGGCVRSVPLSGLLPINNAGLIVSPDISTTTAAAASPLSALQVPSAANFEDAGKKVPRPFKAYPKELTLNLNSDMMFDPELKHAYHNFRSKMLDSVKRTNEGTNAKMRRTSKSPVHPTSTADEKDAAYWERRRKNNEAAKRSRDARRAKEDEIAIKAAFLEQEYIRLKCENDLLKEEITKMKLMMYGH